MVSPSTSALYLPAFRKALSFHELTGYQKKPLEPKGKDGQGPQRRHPARARSANPIDRRSSAFIGVHRRLNSSAGLTRKLSKTIHQPPINADQRRFLAGTAGLALSS